MLSHFRFHSHFKVIHIVFTVLPGKYIAKSSSGRDKAHTNAMV